MKAHHRHELKTNELAEWLANLPQWAKENRTMIIGVLAVIVVAGGLYFWQVYAKNAASVRTRLRFTNLINQLSMSKLQVLQAHSQGRDLSFILFQPADNLKAFAQNAKNKQMAALALIKQAEALRTELHYRAGLVAKRDLVAQIERAKASYAEAMQKAAHDRSLIAAAKFGLGLCEEELGNFEQAAQIYREITTSSDLEGTVARVSAQHRLETMADYRAKIAFRPAPKPKPPAPLDVATQLKPTDTNLPADINLPIETNLPIDINQLLQAPNSVPLVPDIGPKPQTPNSVADIAETNLPGK